MKSVFYHSCIFFVYFFNPYFGLFELVMKIAQRVEKRSKVELLMFPSLWSINTDLLTPHMLHIMKMHKGSNVCACFLFCVVRFEGGIGI